MVAQKEFSDKAVEAYFSELREEDLRFSASQVVVREDGQFGLVFERMIEEVCQSIGCSREDVVEAMERSRQDASFAEEVKRLWVNLRDASRQKSGVEPSTLQERLPDQIVMGYRNGEARAILIMPRQGNDAWRNYAGSWLETAGMQGKEFSVAKVDDNGGGTNVPGIPKTGKLF